MCEFVRTLKSSESLFNSDTDIFTAGFDTLPDSVMFKMKKKQEETGRSLEKIERGMRPVAEQGFALMMNSLLFFEVTIDRIRRSARYFESDGQEST